MNVDEHTRIYSNLPGLLRRSKAKQEITPVDCTSVVNIHSVVPKLKSFRDRG
jgi:hypothetical protein